MKNEVDTHGALVFAPDYSTTVLAAKMCANSNKHSMYIRLQWTSFLLHKEKDSGANT